MVNFLCVAYDEKWIAPTINGIRDPFKLLKFLTFHTVKVLKPTFSYFPFISYFLSMESEAAHANL